MRWQELSRIVNETASRTLKDKGLDAASQAAFAFAFSLFPLVFLIATITGLIVRDEGLRIQLLELLANFMPLETLGTVSGYLMTLQDTNYLGMQMLFSMTLALWTASGVIVVWGEAIGLAYRVRERRGFWRKRLSAVAVLLLVGLLIATAFVFMVIAPVIANFLSHTLGIGSTLPTLLNSVGFPLAVLLMSPAYATLYWMAPPPAQRKSKQIRMFIWPGAILATWLWVTVTYMFRLYVVNFGSYNETYGSLAAFMILLMWMYLTSLTVIVGAHFNVILAERQLSASPIPDKV